MILNQNFFSFHAVEVSKKLLGKKLVYISNGSIFSGIINEVEAYTGLDDPASHASVGITDRTRLMYETYGYTYIYLIYGFYYCLNLTTNGLNDPGGVLIRSIIPVDGISQMMINRNKDDLYNLVNGPGKICQAFGLTKNQNGILLGEHSGIYVEDIGYDPPQINIGPRIGIKKGLDKNWRFRFNK